MIKELGANRLVPACRRPIREQLFRLPLDERLGSRLGFFKAHAPRFFPRVVNHDAGRGTGSDLSGEGETFF